MLIHTQNGIKNTIKRDVPAKEWAQSLLIGNGSLGGAIYGGHTHEIIDLSENTFFSGAKEFNFQPGASEAFIKMREAVKEGDYINSVNASKAFIGLRKNYGTNLPVGHLIINFEGLSTLVCTSYQQSLDIESGMVEVQGNYRSIDSQKSITLHREAFISHPDKALYYTITSSQKLNYTVFFDNQAIPYNSFLQEENLSFDIQAVESIHSDGSCGVKLRGSLDVPQTDGQIHWMKEAIKITEAYNLTLRLKMATNFDYNAPGFIGNAYKKLEKTIKEQWNYETIKQAHILDVKTIMQRIEFDLQGQDDLSERMLQYGRYLLLSSSRSDSTLPTHLQGIWNDHVACKIGWTCDMHLDINTQMNYWLSEAGNLSDSHEPLFNWMEKALIPSGRISAKMHYGLTGWSADLVSNAWGYSAPYWSNTIAPCPTSGIWMMSDFWEHFLYTQDLDFLRERAFPIYQEAVEFFTNYVFKVGDYYTSGPSISPENSFMIDTRPYYFSNGCTYEIVMIRELFEQFIQMTTMLKVDHRLATRCTEILEKLIPYRILEDGTIAEYAHDHCISDPWHRHTSHLLGVFPYHQITPDKTPMLAQAAYTTLCAKVNPYEKWEDTGWARSMLMLYMARLGKGDEALWHIQEMQKKLTHSNLLVMHPPTRGAGSFKEVYELDGNTGLSMCILEMLVQSHDQIIHLLPALPRLWNAGKIKGIKVRGNIEVNMEWKDSKLTRLTLKSAFEQSVWVHYKGAKKYIRLNAFDETLVEDFVNTIS
jgi:alpha-L-fucosidase 2